ncbi:MAG: hypothetical protein E7618_00655 [Ruminococcaceae bacterium]|nr:hypothetical protein [Oscillospiraceae bacterium]
MSVMNVKRTITLWFLALLLVLTPILHACGVENGGDDNTGEPSGESETTDSLTQEETPGSAEADGRYLDGIRLADWLYRADKDNEGLEKGWHTKSTSIGWTKTTFPESYSYSTYSWFSLKFRCDDLALNEGERALIRFSGMPYYTEYWLNGEKIGDHTGRFDAFTFDITEQLKVGEENYFAIRCTNPDTKNDLDGLLYKHIGLSFTANPRVQEPAYLYVVPTVYAEDAVVEENCEDGTVSIHLTLRNTTSEAMNVVLESAISEEATGIRLERVRTTVTAAPGVSTHTVSIKLNSFRYWSPEDPFLYHSEVTVENADGSEDTLSRLTAFRTLKVNEDGYYELNGETYFLKGLLVTNVFAESFETGKNASYYYDYITYLKAAGFNTLRFLDTVPLPEILDWCDRIGMIVYSEHPMAWHKVDDPQGRTEQLFKDTVIAALKTLRSHPSVLIFGFQNETDIKTSSGEATIDLYETIKSGPSWARQYAEDMVFMLQSGRFDGNRSLGSASNPGSTTWDGYMGNEEAGASEELIPSHVSNMYSRDMGDIHFYPLQPYDSEVLAKYRALEQYKRGVLLSEAGIGTLYNIVSLLANRELHGISTNGSAYLPQISELRQYYTSYGLDRIFTSPEALLRASNKMSALQKTRLMSYIRSIDTMNGYIMTGGIDLNGLGEGMVGEYGETKDGFAEALANGWEDLRFSILTDSLTYYRGASMTLDIELSDLKQQLTSNREYTAVVSIRGENGTVWQKKYTFKPAGDPFNTAICSETVKLDFAGGDYVINVELEKGALPANNEYAISVFDRDSQASVRGKTVYTIGVKTAVTAFLTERGATVRSYTAGDTIGKNVLLVGSNLNDSSLAQVVEAAKSGAHVIFLTKEAFTANAKVRSALGVNGTVYTYNDWLYHGERIVYRNAVTAGLQNRCLMDTLYYESVYSPTGIIKATTPDDVSIGFVHLGGNDVNQEFEFRGGYQLATYQKGSGQMTLSTLNLSDNLDSPVAATLLLNLITK